MADPKPITKVRAFPSPESWEKWLQQNHATSNGLWVRFYKKHTGKKSIVYAEALDGALCYGWIDGQLKKYDNDSWIQKFTPRKPGSIWSKRNTKRAGELIKSKRMKPAGLSAVKAAKADGRWEKAYDSPGKMEIPADFLRKLRKNKEGYAFFKTLNRANLYAIAWRLQTAKKTETREKRMEAILEMLTEGKKFH